MGHPPSSSSTTDGSKVEATWTRLPLSVALAFDSGGLQRNEPAIMTLGGRQGGALASRLALGGKTRRASGAGLDS